MQQKTQRRKKQRNEKNKETRKVNKKIKSAHKNPLNEKTAFAFVVALTRVSLAV